MIKHIKQNWENASWEGSRIAQLKRSLKLTHKQRFDALEELAEVSNWLANSGQKHQFNRLCAAPDKK